MAAPSYGTARKQLLDSFICSSSDAKPGERSATGLLLLQGCAAAVHLNGDTPTQRVRAFGWTCGKPLPQLCGDEHLIGDARRR
jgi:hypothetical protein